MVQKWLFFTSMALFVIAVRQLEQLCSIAENVRSKSGCWHVNPTSDTALNLFLYLVHHFAPINAMRAFKDQLFCLDREARVISIDTTEARFKLASANRKVLRVRLIYSEIHPMLTVRVFLVVVAPKFLGCRQYAQVMNIYV